MPLSLLPEHKIGFFVLFWASEPPFSGFSSTGTPVFGLFEHKIGVFVLFWGLEPSFSGFLSTKLRFLCAFALRNPHFQAFRAQNRGFCALFGFGTPIFGLFEHKIGIFVLG